MTAEQLKNSILQEAISGRLVPQDPNDEPAAVLLQRIHEEKAKLVKEGKLKKKNFVETPIKEEEIPFEIPSSWAWLRISDLCYITNGFTPLRTEPRFWTNGSISWFTVEDIRKQGEIINYTTQKITPAATTQERIVRAGSTLLCCTASVGQCAITNIPLTTNQQFNALTVKEWFMPIVDDKYLYWFAKTLAPILHSLAGQTTFEFVSVKKVGSILIPLPPLAEQKRIVAKIEELLPIVEQYGKAQKELDELNAALPARLRQSILQEAISGRLVPQDPNDEPASTLLERVRLARESLLREKKVKSKDIDSAPIQEDERTFELPAQWEFVRLNYVATIARGGSPRPIKEYLTDSPNGYNWIKIGDTEKGGKYINHTKERIKPEGLKKSRLIHKGDFLLTNSMSFGRPYISNIEGCIHDGWLVISPAFGEVFDKDYLYYVLSSPYVKDQFLGKVSGAVVQNLNSDKVATSVIPLPPLAEQQRIVAKIEELFTQIDKITK